MRGQEDSPQKVLLLANTRVLGQENWLLVQRALAKNRALAFAVVVCDDGRRSVESEQLGERWHEYLTCQATLREPVGAEVLEVFAELVDSEKFDSLRVTGFKLLNRKDLSGTFRFLDREPFFQATALSVIDMLLRQKPDLLVFPVTPHEFVPYLAWKIAEWMEMETLFFQPSSIAPAMRPRRGLGQDLPRAGSVKHDEAAMAHVTRIADQTFSALERGKAPRYMALQENSHRRARHYLSRIARWRFFIRWLGVERFPDSINAPFLAERRSFGLRVLKVLGPTVLQKSLNNSARALGKGPRGAKRYALFALHYEPERTSIPEGLSMDFQGHAIAAARAFLPSDLELLVAEHPSQTSSALRGFVGRSPLFYSLIASLPNTCMVSNPQGSKELVSEAEAIFTLTGTVGIEGPIAGTPVLYFGAPWWEGMPGTLAVQSGNKWSDVQALPMPSREQARGFLQELHSTLMLPGVGAETVRTVEERLGPLPGGFLVAEALEIVLAIEAALESY